MRTSRGLPFNACVNARACTSTLGKPAHLSVNHELHQGVALPGLTHLTYRWRESASGAQVDKQSNRQITEENSSGTILKHVKSVESVLCDKHKFSSYVSN